jgi:hypothetical protein
MEFNEYFDHVKQALTVQDVKGIRYKYEIAQGENVTDIEVNPFLCLTYLTSYGGELKSKQTKKNSRYFTSSHNSKIPASRRFTTFPYKR